MKLSVCMILVVCFAFVIISHSQAVSVQASCVYTDADDTGVYRVVCDGAHADITWYASGMLSAGVDLSYCIKSVCSCGGKIVFLCDDAPNGQLIVYVYYVGADVLDSFSLNGVYLYADTDFCCDHNALYIENYQNCMELTAYTFSGAVRGTYSFPNKITALTHGFSGGVYAAVEDSLYTLSGDSFSEISGGWVDAPLSPVGGNILVSLHGAAYVLDGDRIVKTFDIDIDSPAVSGCVIGNRLYYPCGNTVYGYDTVSGEKVCYYDCGKSVFALYADGDTVQAVSDAEGSVTSIRSDHFIRIERPDTNNAVDPRDVNNDISDMDSDVYHIDWQNYQISGIPSETTIAAFKGNMRYSGYEVTVYRDSVEKKSGNVGTAMTAVFMSESESITFELAVDGDLTGEGSRNTRDLNILMDYLIGAAEFNGVYTIATDLSGDGCVSIIDMALMKRSI